jgi:hypothetical protein
MNVRFVIKLTNRFYDKELVQYSEQNATLRGQRTLITCS